MTTRYMIGLLCSHILSAQVAFGQAEKGSKDEHSERIHQVIANLGMTSDPQMPFFGSRSYKSIVQLLRENPRESVYWLVKELHTVDATAVYRSDVTTQTQRDQLHVVWCLRALKYLTGKEFRARTKHRLPPYEEDDESTQGAVELYGSNDPRKETKIPIPFSGEWASRGLVFFAPSDAQRNIIKQWNDWYAKNGATFKPANLDRDPGDWVY